MNEPSDLYFIAIMLPHQTNEEIKMFKNDMALRFRSKKALRTASHITLKSPFNTPAAAHRQLLQWFGQLSITIPPFTQALKDFGAFSNKHNPVIFVKPVMNQSLQQLQNEVLQQFIGAFPNKTISSNEHAFSPHITIAYRDLLPASFKDAWEAYQYMQYNALFEVNSFQLLQHNDGRWEVIDSFLLPSQNTAIPQ